MKKIKNGLLVILEGGEGVGKTTQAKALVEYYNSKGYSAKYFREPGGDKLAEDIRNMVLYNEMDVVTETLLINAARNINIQTNILPALKDGNIVILDRFTKSTLVYQGDLKNGNIDFIYNCIDEVTKDLRNDDRFIIEFTLLCDPEEAIKRAAAEGHERNKFDVMPIEKYTQINNSYKYFYHSNNICEYYYPITSMVNTTNMNSDEVLNKLVIFIDKFLKECDITQE